MLQGNTENLPLQNIFQTLDLNQQEGILTVSYQKLERHIAIRPSGVSLLCERPGASKVLQQVTTRLKILSQNEYENVFSTISQERPPGDILVERHLLAPSQTGDAIREQFLEYLYEIFAWQNARYSFEVRAVAEEKMIFTSQEMKPYLEFPVNSILMEVARREDEWSRIRRVIPSAHQIFQLSPKANTADFGTLGIDLHPTRIDNLVSLIDGTRSVDEIVEASCIPPFFVFSAIRCLIDAKLVGIMSVQARRELAELLRQKFQMERVASVYRSILEDEPDDVSTRRNLIAYLERKKALPDELVPHYRRMAQSCYDAGDLPGAEENLQKVLGQTPKDLVATQQLVYVHLRANKTKAWTQSLREYVNLIKRLRKFDDGAAFLEGIAESREVEPWVIQEAAHLYLLAGKPQEAVPHYDKAAKLYASEGDLRRLRGIVQKLEVCDTKLAARWRKHIDNASSGPRRTPRFIKAATACMLFIALGLFGFYEWDARIVYAEVIKEARMSVKEDKLDRATTMLDEFAESYRFTVIAQNISKEQELLKQLHDKIVTERSLEHIRDKDKGPALSNNAESFFTEASRLKLSGDWQGALAKLEEINFDGTSPQLRSDIEREARFIREYLTQANQLQGKARALEGKGQLEEANKLYMKLVQSYPNSPWARRIRLPIQLAVRPPHATVRVGSEVVPGPPYVLKIKPRTIPVVEVSSPTFRSRSVTIDPSLGFSALIELEKDVLWTRPLKAVVEAELAANAHHFFVGTRSGRVLCLDRRTGDVVWTFQLEGLGDCLGKIRLVGDDLIFTGTDGALYRVRQKTGERVYRFPIPGGPSDQVSAMTRVPMTQVTDSNVVFIMTTHGRVVAIDLETPGSLWVRSLGGVGDLPPMLAGQAVVVANRHGRIMCLDRETGEHTWRKETDAQITVPPLPHGNHVVVGFDDGRVQAMSLSSGDVIWSRDFISKAAGQLVPLDDSRVIRLGENGTLTCLDLATGETAWEERGSSRFTLRPVVASGRVYTVDNSGVIHVHDGETGRPLWTHAVGTAPSSALLPDRDVLLIPMENRSLQAIPLQSK